MFRFANNEILWLLPVIFVFAVAFWAYTKRKRRQLAEFGDEALMAELMPNASRVRPAVKFSIVMVALALLILAAARPQWGQSERTEKRQGIEAIVALDISNSMLAEDVAPNRLERAKQMLSKLMDNMVNDKVGLVVFAGDAFVQLPITCDYVSAKMFLNSIKPELIKTQGTAIGQALATSIRCFGEQSDASRAIILITDGENHEDDAVAVAKRAKEMGIQVLVVGIGKPEGSPIPLPGTNNFRKDRQGNVVVSKLNEDMCREIAQAGGGIYVRCDNTNTATKAIQKELDKLATQEIETQVYTDYNEQFQSFALLALMLLVIDFFIFNRKNKALTKLDIFGENGKWTMDNGKLSVLVLMLLVSMNTFAQREAGDVRRGNKEYNKQNYTEAEVDYRRGLEANKNSYEAHYNLGDALFKQDKYADAQTEFETAAKMLDKKEDKERYAKAMHNIGNCNFAQQQYDKAVAAYMESLRANPKDNDTRYNLVKAMEMLQQQQQQEQQQQEQQEQDQQQEQQEQQAQETEDRMDKETAEQILQALEQDEQDTQEKLQRQQGKKRRVEKEW
ncbi:MAG: VWA domain-containing protein [Paludibacteraceae bacterium]|nr:VWA domain-containing protein [Paludibacteraceae bacterium]